MIQLVLPTALLLLLAMPAAARHRDDTAAKSRLFISPMGEPFRSDLSGDPEAAWFTGADTDHDGRISLAEFRADARRWFRIADRGHDGEIDPDDIDSYENVLVPEIRVADVPQATGRPKAEDGGRTGRGGRRGGMGGSGGGSGPGGGGFGGGRQQGHRSDGGGEQASRSSTVRATRQGAARYGYLDLPEPLTAADANLNRGIDAGEMDRAAVQRFALLDRNGDGYLDRRELPRVDTRTSGSASHRGGPPPGGRPPGERPPPDRDRQLGGGDREQD